MPINVVSDTASLLWRLRAYGRAVPDEFWEAAVAYAKPIFGQPGSPSSMSTWRS
jgi:hypothetical protein